MSKMDLKESQTLGTKLTGEEIEELICYRLDMLEEELLLVGYEDNVLIFSKEKISELFKILNVDTIVEAYYINSHEEQVKIKLINKKEVLLEIIG